MQRTNCTFEGNAAHTGGAIEAEQWSLVVADSKFIDNVASGNPPSDIGGGYGKAFGGAIDLQLSRLHVKRTLFQGNALEEGVTTGGGGGAISVQYESQSPLTCANCQFIGNSCVTVVPGEYNEGGAVFATHGGGTGGSYVVPQFINCVFKGNTASTNGGALSCRYGALVKDCTLSENDAATGWGGGFYGALKGGSTTEFTNSIFWGNTAALSDPLPLIQHQYKIAGPNTVAISYTCVEASTAAPGTGNTNADPSFADAQLRLRPCSPLVDAGLASLRPADTLDVDENMNLTELHPLDFDLTPRVKGGALDMGAYELTPICVGDLNEDGIVGGADLGELLAAWGACAGCPSDLNCDDAVNGADLGTLLAAWGPCAAGGESLMMAFNAAGGTPADLLACLGATTIEEATEILADMSFGDMEDLLMGILGETGGSQY